MNGAKLLVAVVVVVSGCVTPAPSEPAIIEVRSTIGDLLGGARVSTAGQVITTGENGRAVLMLAPGTARPEGVRARVQCPPEFRASNEFVDVPRAQARTLDERRDALVTVATCVPLQMDVAVVASSHGVPRCPVFIDGAKRSETDAHGFAHVLVRGTPDAQVTVELGAPSGGRASKWRAAKTFRIPDHESVVTLEGTPPAVRAKAPRAAGPRKIYRIG